MAALERVDRHVEHSHMVSHEECVELRLLQFLDGFFHMGEVEIHVGPGARIAPCAGMDRCRAHECAETQLTSGSHVKILYWSARPRSGRSRRLTLNIATADEPHPSSGQNKKGPPGIPGGPKQPS